MLKFILKFIKKPSFLNQNNINNNTTTINNNNTTINNNYYYNNSTTNKKTNINRKFRYSKFLGIFFLFSILLAFFFIFIFFKHYNILFLVIKSFYLILIFLILIYTLCIFKCKDYKYNHNLYFFSFYSLIHLFTLIIFFKYYQTNINNLHLQLMNLSNINLLIINKQELLFSSFFQIFNISFILSYYSINLYLVITKRYYKNIELSIINLFFITIFLIITIWILSNKCILLFNYLKA